MGKSVVGDFQNDIVLVGFSSPHGLQAEDHATSRQLVMPAEVTDIGVENITLKPTAFEDARSRELEIKEFVRQDDGFQIDLLNFSVGGTQLRGAETAEGCEAFLQYLIGDGAEDMPLAERVEALQKQAILLNLYPVLNFTRAQISDYKPYLPYRIPVIARVARFSTERAKENEEPTIASLGLEFIYNPIHDSYSRDINEFDQWEQVTPYTESQNFIEIHKSLQLLFGFDRALDESLREDRSSTKQKEVIDEDEESAEPAEEEAPAKAE